ncbi:MAG: hypothetical protein Ta2D_03240 [Rickettsiales bacterium]|nr:MAG: hypothetical protein Ta2D_03240 [Rickettsiales bacterium]
MLCLKKFFYIILLILALVSCEQRECIQADDFGEWDTETFVLKSKMDLCSVPDNFEDGLQDAEETVANALRSGYFLKQNGKTTTSTSTVSSGGNTTTVENSETVDLEYNEVFNHPIPIDAIKNCKITLKEKLKSTEFDASASGPYAVLKYILSLDDTEKKVYYGTPAAPSSYMTFDGCGSTVATMNKAVMELYLLGLTSATLKCQRQPSTNYVYDRFESGWRKMKEFSKVTGGIKVGEGQTVEIRAAGDISLSHPIIKPYSFIQNTNKVQDANFLMNSKIPINLNGSLIIDGRTLSETPSNYKSTDSMKKRIEFLRRAVIVIDSVSPDTIFDDNLNYISGPSLHFDPNNITCNNGECLTSYPSADVELLKNNDYYALQNGYLKTLGGQLLSKESYEYFTQKPFHSDETTGDFTFDKAKNGYIMMNDSLSVSNISYPVKVAFRNFGDQNCNITLTASDNTTASVNVKTGGNWFFAGNSSSSVWLKYVTPDVNKPYTISFSKGNSCNSKIGIFLIPQLMVKVQNSGFVTFKNIYQNDVSLKYSIVNPSADEQNFFEFATNLTWKSISVNGTSWNGGENVFIRKNQIMMFSDENWFTYSGNDTTGYTINMRFPKIIPQGNTPSASNLVMLIEKRPAVLCKENLVEKYDNPDCDKKSYNGADGQPVSYCSLSKKFSSDCKNSGSTRCPNGCYMKLFTQKPAAGYPAADANKVTAFKSDNSNFYKQVYYPDPSDKKVADMSGQYNCPDPSYIEGVSVPSGDGAPKEGDIMAAKDADGHDISQVTEASCAACYSSIVGSRPSLTFDVSLPQCYDLENYTKAARNFNPNSNKSTTDGVTPKTDNEVILYGNLSKQDYDDGARKLPSLERISDNYASLENFKLNTDYLVIPDDDNGEAYYTEIVYTSAPTPVPVGKISLIKLLIVKNSSFDFTTTSNVTPNYTLSYSQSARFKNGDQLTIVVANKDWGEGTNQNKLENVRDWVTKHDIYYAGGLPSAGQTNTGQVEKRSSIDFGKPISDYTVKYSFAPDGFLRDNASGSTRYLFSRKSAGDNVDNYRLFFKIADKRFSERGSCKWYEEPVPSDTIEYSCDGETWSTTYPSWTDTTTTPPTQFTGCGIGTKKVWCSPSISNCGGSEVEYPREFRLYEKTMNTKPRVSIWKDMEYGETTCPTGDIYVNGVVYKCASAGHIEQVYVDQPGKWKLILKDCPDSYTSQGLKCAYTQISEDVFYYVPTSCSVPPAFAAEWDCSNSTIQALDTYMSQDKWKFVQKTCPYNAIGITCVATADATGDIENWKVTTSTGSIFTERCIFGGGVDANGRACTTTIDKIQPIDGICPATSLTSPLNSVSNIPYYAVEDGVVQETPRADEYMMQDKTRILMDKGLEASCPAAGVDNGGIHYTCLPAAEQDDTGSWKYIEDECPHSSSIKNIGGVPYVCSSRVTDHTYTQWKYLKSTCPELDGWQCRPGSMQTNPDKWLYIKDCNAKWYSREVLDYTNMQTVRQRYRSTECEDLYQNNDGLYVVTLRSPKNFTSSGSIDSALEGEFSTNLLSKAMADASGMVTRYLVNPILEKFDGKTMGLQKTATSTKDNPNFKVCDTTDKSACNKYRASGWKLGCAKGDLLCFKILDRTRPNFIGCEDESELETLECIIHTPESNAFTTFCKKGTPNCYQICDSDVISNDCGVYTEISNNDNLAVDPNFGLMCSQGTAGCYRNCSGLSNELYASQCIKVNDNTGFSKRFYIKLITSNYYQAFLKIGFALSLSIYGLWSLMGFAKITHTELIKRMCKISFIYLFVSETGWYYYDRFIIAFFKDGVDYMTFAMTGVFSQNGTIMGALQKNDFSDASILFTGTDRNLALMFSTEVSYKIFGLLFVSFFGWAYVIILYGAIITYLFAMADVFVSYVTAHLIVSILLGFGPIFIAFLAFEKTKKMFDKWINAIVGFSLEQILMLTTMHLFNLVIYGALKFTLSYRVCWRPIWVLNLPFFGRMNLLHFWKASNASTAADAAKDVPGLFRILIIYILADLIKDFISMASKFGKSLSGSELTIHGTGGLGNFATEWLAEKKGVLTQAMGKGAESAVSAAGKRLINYKTDDEEKAEEEKMKPIREGMKTAERAGQNASENYLAEQKKKNGKLTDEDLRQAATIQKKAQADSLQKSGAVQSYMDLQKLQTGEEVTADKALEKLMDSNPSEFVGPQSSGILGGTGWLTQGAAKFKTWTKHKTANNAAQNTEDGKVDIGRISKLDPDHHIFSGKSDTKEALAGAITDKKESDKRLKENKKEFEAWNKTEEKRKYLKTNLALWREEAEKNPGSYKVQLKVKAAEDELRKFNDKNARDPKFEALFAGKTREQMLKEREREYIDSAEDGHLYNHMVQKPGPFDSKGPPGLFSKEGGYAGYGDMQQGTYDHLQKMEKDLEKEIDAKLRDMKD